MNRVSWISLIAAICVVVIHVVYINPPIWLSDITRVAVPWFFLVSGYFAAREFVQGGGYWKLMTKRVNTLCVPYLTLNTFWFFAYSGLVWLSIRYFGSKDVVDFSLSGYVKAIGFNLNTTPVISALWYVRCLLLFFLLMPLFMILMRKKEWISRLIVMLVFATGTIYEYCHLQIFPLFGFNIRGLPFFVVGLHLWMWPIKIHRMAGALISALAFVIFEFMELSIPAIGATLSLIWFLLPELAAPSWMRTITFPIYVLHQMMLYCLLIPLRFVKIEGCGVVKSMILIVGSIGLSIVVAKIINRYTPRLSQVVFGGRS